MAPFASDARDRYRAEGYLFPVPILAGAELAQYRAAVDALEAKLGRDKMKVPLKQEHLRNPAIWALTIHPKVLGLVEVALGPDLVLVSTSFFIKYPEPPESSQAQRDKGSWYVGWHQDVTYWGFEPPIAASIWLAIDDADAANGCMRVVPGSHKGGILPHGKAATPGNVLSVNQDIPREHFDESSAVDFEMRAGEASVHHGLLIHGSNPNRSDRRRCGLTIQYTTPEVRLGGSMKDYWQPILVRGVDRFGRLAMSPPPVFADGAGAGDAARLG